MRMTAFYLHEEKKSTLQRRHKSKAGITLGRAINMTHWRGRSSPNFENNRASRRQFVVLMNMIFFAFWNEELHKTSSAVYIRFSEQHWGGKGGGGSREQDYV